MLGKIFDFPSTFLERSWGKKTSNKTAKPVLFVQEFFFPYVISRLSCEVIGPAAVHSLHREWERSVSVRHHEIVRPRLRGPTFEKSGVFPKEKERRRRVSREVG